MKAWVSELIQLLAVIGVALFGAVARQAYDYRKGADVSLWDFLARLMVAGFAGFLMANFAGHYNIEPRWLGLLAGVAGFFAIETIECIRRFVKGRFGIG